MDLDGRAHIERGVEKSYWELSHSLKLYPSIYLVVFQSGMILYIHICYLLLNNYNIWYIIYIFSIDTYPYVSILYILIFGELEVERVSTAIVRTLVISVSLPVLYIFVDCCMTK